MRYKKAQIKLFETIAVLIIFFFLLAIGLVFYYNYQSASIELEKEKMAELYAFQLATKTFSMPELDCSVGGLRLANCFDKIKIKEFKELLKENDARTFYFQDFGLATIIIKDLYPGGEEQILLYNLTPKSYKSKYTSFSPMILFNPVVGDKGCMNLARGECSFGIVEVSYYVE